MMKKSGKIIIGSITAVVFIVFFSIKTTVVRSGKTATLGYQPDVWKEWK